MEILQCVFIESFCVSILAVFELVQSLDTNYLKVNEGLFSKKNGRYAYTKRHFFEKTTQFRFQLLQKCNLKAVKKSYKKKKIRCVWVLKKNADAYRCFDILTPIDRVLLRIVA